MVVARYDSSFPGHDSTAFAAWGGATSRVSVQIRSILNDHGIFRPRRVIAVSQFGSD